MNDLVLLAGNSLIGLLFLGLWFADKKQRSYFAWWGIADICLGFAAMTALFMSIQDGVGENGGAWRLLVVPLAASGYVAMAGGSLRYRGHQFSWRDALVLAIAYIALGVGARYAFPPAAKWLTAIVLGLSLGSMAWALWSHNALERLASGLYAARAANAVWLVLGDGMMLNSPHTPLAHVLTLSASACLLIAIFRRKTTELEHHNELLTFSNRLITALQTPTDERSLAEEALRQLERHTSGQGALVHLIDDSGRWFDLIAAHGHTQEVLQVVHRMPVDSTLSGQAVRMRKTVFTHDYANEPGAWSVLADAYRRAGITVNVSVPLVSENQPLGVLNISYPEGSELTANEIDTLKSSGQVLGTNLDRVRNVRDLAYRANHDTLTGLGNRDALHHCVEALRINRRRDVFAMLLIDLDRFKEVNDALGHKTGDQLLREIARILRSSLSGQTGQAFRLGGDEFAIILPQLASEDEGRKLAGALAVNISQRLQVAEMVLRIDVSIGIAFAPRHGNNSHELLRCADVAMYRAKNNGTGIEVYERALDPHSAERLELLARIPEAIRREEFVLYYQPQLDLHNHRLVACEALIRWQHPDRGLLPPGEFIPLAEVSDVIRPLTEWITNTAMEQASKWQTNRLPLRVAFNLSARNILDPNFVPHLLSMLETHGLKPFNVELELTETVLLHDPANSALVLHELAKRGFVLALDDFGTGFSSLSYLKRYPFSILKIDRSFVSDMHKDNASLEIVRSTIQLAHALGMKVVAEGVEDEQTLNSLRTLGCNYAQGYFIGRPMMATQIAAWQKEAPVLRVAG
ncbi:MAG: EAL domain-containing protein [Rhodocyclaceae bacterium]|nr:EAL domain-containing protein [Rhodocyclaceae bacterium]